MNKRKRKEDRTPAIMPPGMSEKALQIKVIRILREQGFRVLHAYDSFKSDSGFPDLHAVHVEEKKLIVIELKREGQSPRDDQVEVLAAYEGYGYSCIYMASVGFGAHTRAFSSVCSAGNG